MTDPKGTISTLKAAIADLEMQMAALTPDTELQARVEVLEAQTAAQAQAIEMFEAQLAQTEDEKAYKLALALTLANTAYNALIVLNERHEVIAINDAAEALFNVERPLTRNVEAVTGTPEIEMMVTDALDNQEESFEEQMLVAGRPFRVQARVIRREGHVFTGLAMQDVSELVRLNRARRDMVANISHELRTPIANIRLIIEGLFHDQDKPKRKQSTSALKAIARETDSLLWLVQELLDLSMIETGQAILRMIDLPLDELAREAIDRLADQSEAKGTPLVSAIGRIPVLADRDQARRVLINLLHNAIKWSPPGEPIQIDAREVGDEVRIEVLDHGPGVPIDQRERIFERFYQVDPSRSGGDGTGLGLAICKHIVEAHGGQLWVEDNPDGRGACFAFTLPKGEDTAFDIDADDVPF